MLGELTPNEIEKLLHEQVIGRIGCTANGMPYVVPVTYAYDGKHIYAHSKEGRKIQIMRQNPIVCFEVDRMENLNNWQSVIAWGKYEELKNNDCKMGLHKLVVRFHDLVTSDTSMAAENSPDAHQNDAGPYKAVVFRIEVKEKTGRFEKH